MKIAIDLTALYGRKKTGVEYYAVDLYRALMKTDHDIIPIVHVRNEIDDNANTYVIPKCPRLWLENVALSCAIRKIKADIVFFPVFAPPVDIYFGCRSKIFKIIHDLVFFKYRDTINLAAKIYYTPKTLWMFKHADMVLTISETIKKELQPYTSRPIRNCGENIAQDFLDCDDKASEDDLHRWNLSGGGYFVSASTIEPRKNLKYLLSFIRPVLKKKGMKLVLVGKVRTTKDKELSRLISEMKEDIIFTDYVETHEMISLYRFAHAFILMSIYEGFGRTPFEALASGCRRIVLSDIPIFRETFGGEAMFLPLEDPETCAQRLMTEEIKEVSSDFKIPFDVLENNITQLLKEQEILLKK